MGMPHSRTRLSARRRSGIAALAVLLGAAPALAAPLKFKKKECIDCHSKQADRYASYKYAHPAAREKKCEECHLRHGLVPKLLLKESGNGFCYRCHKRESIGTDKANVHSVLRKGSCTSCHDPHGSDARHMLKQAGNDACYSCHRREPFQKKVVHAVVARDGCLTCHLAHASAEKDLLSAPQAKLCGRCHAPGAAAFQKAHEKYPVATCTGCHDPHSAERPKLLRASVHPPVAESGCDSCHVDARVREAVRGLGARREALRELPRRAEARRRRSGPALAGEAGRVPRVP